MQAELLANDLSQDDEVGDNEEDRLLVSSYKVSSSSRMFSTNQEADHSSSSAEPARRHLSSVNDHQDNISLLDERTRFDPSSFILIQNDTRLADIARSRSFRSVSSHESKS